jgi:hypothetical protein
MDTLMSVLSLPLVQAALVAAASHVVVWAVKKLPSLPGGYSAAKRALAISMLNWAAKATAAPPAAPEAAPVALNKAL